MEPITTQQASSDEAQQQQAQQRREDQELEAIKAAKMAAGITYPLLVLQTSDPEDAAKPGPFLAFRRPTAAEWHRYRTESSTPDPAVKANACQTIVIPCCVYPALPRFLQMVAERPGLIEFAGSELLGYAGAENAKKVARL